MKAKDTIIQVLSKIVVYLKTNKTSSASIAFAAVSLVLILVGMLALNEFVVSICILIILEAGMAAFLHKAELWKHGVLLAAQLLAGVIIGRVSLVIICIIAYVAATVALQFMEEK